MIFKDGKTFSAYVRSKLHSGYITIFALIVLTNCDYQLTASPCVLF